MIQIQKLIQDTSRDPGLEEGVCFALQLVSFGEEGFLACPQLCQSGSLVLKLGAQFLLLLRGWFCQRVGSVGGGGGEFGLVEVDRAEV